MDNAEIYIYVGMQDLKLNRRKDVAQKIKEARELGELSENAEYDAAKEEQRDIELRIEGKERAFHEAGRNVCRW